MPESLRNLRSRVRKIRSTIKITRAMSMVAAAKQRRALAVFRASRPYAEKLQALVARVAASLPEEFAHPLFEEREEQRLLMVLFSGDRGLAGAFNSRIIGRTERFLRERGKERCALYCIGRRGRDYFRRRGWRIVEEVLELRGRADVEIARRVAADLQARFVRRETDAIYLAYNGVLSMTTYQERIEKFLPLAPEALRGGDREVAGVQYIIEPSLEEVFAQLLPRYAEARLYATMAETLTAEHSARMVAMSGATRNCEDLIQSLTLRMNKARQDSITRQILEIVGGAEALRS